MLANITKQMHEFKMRDVDKLSLGDIDTLGAMVTDLANLTSKVHKIAKAAAGHEH
jgi:hypothetical protein